MMDKTLAQLFIDSFMGDGSGTPQGTVITSTGTQWKPFGEGWLDKLPIKKEKHEKIHPPVDFEVFRRRLDKAEQDV